MPPAFVSFIRAMPIAVRCSAIDRTRDLLNFPELSGRPVRLADEFFYAHPVLGSYAEALILHPDDPSHNDMVTAADFHIVPAPRRRTRLEEQTAQ